MEQKPKQIKRKRITDKELEVIKSVFSDNEPLLLALRKVFLQLKLDKFETTLIDNSITKKPNVVDVIAKCFLPEIDPETPIQQVIDLWMTIDMKDKDVDEAYPHIVARSLLIQYLKEQLDVLRGNKGKMKFTDFNFSKNNSAEDIYIDLIVRNTIITHTEQQLFQLQTLAGSKTETVEETMARLSKDSSK